MSDKGAGKFTPGPWTWRTDENTDWDGVSSLGKYPDMDKLRGPDPKEHSVLGGVWHNDSTGGIGLNGNNPEADARLIAAAPELLEELEAICAEAESWHSVHGHEANSVQCDSICERIPKMRAAIQKAKGESA